MNKTSSLKSFQGPRRAFVVIKHTELFASVVADNAIEAYDAGYALFGSVHVIEQNEFAAWYTEALKA